MQTIRLRRRLLAALVTALFLAVQTGPAVAGMVGTQELLEQAQVAEQRSELLAQLQRSDVRDQLETLGVDPAQAKARVARLSDTQVSQLHGRLERLPAGGSAAGIIVLFLLVFIITDALGATDIFTFIDPIS